MKKTHLLFIVIFFVLGISLVYVLQQQFSSKRSTIITPSPIAAINEEANHATNPSELTPEDKLLENTDLDPNNIGFTCDPITGQCE